QVPVDRHWRQSGGAIWCPMVYDVAAGEMRALVDDKVESQFTRAMRYVDVLDARVVVPSAGPPCFLDPELFHLNRITGDELSIFPDQIEFIDRLAAAGHSGILAIPGTEIEIMPDKYTVRHPMADDDVAAIFTDKLTYLRSYQADWTPWLDDLKANWHVPTSDLVPTLKAWWGPLLAMAPTLRNAVGA